MFITTNILMYYLFNYLIIFLITFAATLVCDILDTIKNKTEIRVLAAIIDSLISSGLLCLIASFIDLPESALLILAIVFGANSMALSNYIRTSLSGNNFVSILLNFLYSNEDIKNALGGSDEDEIDDKDNNDKK